MPDNLNFFLTMQFYRSQACDPRAFLSAICTLRVLSCCLLFVLVQQTRWILADLPFECYFPEVIPPNNFWWLSRSPPHVFCSSKFEWSPLWILPKFSAIPSFGFSVTTYPPPLPQGENYDQSLMRLAIIMQHANMAYHVQRAYKRPTIWLLREGRYGWF